jgi:hypothetical protein
VEGFKWELGFSISTWNKKDSFGGDNNSNAHHDFLLYKQNICCHLQHGYAPFNKS